MLNSPRNKYSFSNTKNDQNPLEISDFQRV